MDDSQIDDVWIARTANGRWSGIEPGNLRPVGVGAAVQRARRLAYSDRVNLKEKVFQ